MLPSHTAAAGDDKRSAQKGGSNKVLGSSSRAGKKQPLVQPLGRAPTNPKENAESVLWFVLVGGFFLTGAASVGSMRLTNNAVVVPLGEWPVPVFNEKGRVRAPQALPSLAVTATLTAVLRPVWHPSADCHD